MAMRTAAGAAGLENSSSRPATYETSSLTSGANAGCSGRSVLAGDGSTAQRIPPASSKVKIDPAPVGDPAVNAAGESLYTLKPKQLKVGDTEVIKLSYSTVPEAFNAGPSSTTIALIVLGILLVVAVAVLAVFLSRQRRMPLGEDEGYDEEYEEDLAEEADLTNAPASGDDSENGDDIEELDWSDRDR